jgi:hypothetical protein
LRRLLAAMVDRLSLEQRLAELAAAARATAQSLPPGEERDAMLLRAHQCDLAAEMVLALAQPSPR